MTILLHLARSSQRSKCEITGLDSLKTSNYSPKDSQQLAAYLNNWYVLMNLKQISINRPPSSSLTSAPFFLFTHKVIFTFCLFFLKQEYLGVFCRFVICAISVLGNENIDYIFVLTLPYNLIQASSSCMWIKSAFIYV